MTTTIRSGPSAEQDTPSAPTAVPFSRSPDHRRTCELCSSTTSSALRPDVELSDVATGNVLLIAKDSVVAKAIGAALSRTGLRSAFAASCLEACEFATHGRVDLILLNRALLDCSGLSCWRGLRTRDEFRTTPILTFGQHQDACDVAANVGTILDTSTRTAATRVEYAGIVLDRIAQRATCDGQEIPLALAQFRLLEYFLSHPGRVLSREELFARVWGGQGPVGRRIDVYVASIRKILAGQSGREFFRAVRGIGYIFGNDKQRHSGVASRLGAECRVIFASSIESAASNCWLDHATNSLRRDNDCFHLSPREFAVLELLMLNSNIALSRSIIAGCIWGRNNVDLRTVDAMISRLRKAIRQDSSSDRPIRSVPGRGYQFQE
jgi:two-component system phosphate regulon response regulator PhoB